MLGLFLCELSIYSLLFLSYSVSGGNYLTRLVAALPQTEAEPQLCVSASVERSPRDILVAAVGYQGRLSTARTLRKTHHAEIMSKPITRSKQTTEGLLIEPEGDSNVALFTFLQQMQGRREGQIV